MKTRRLLATTAGLLAAALLSLAGPSGNTAHAGGLPGARHPQAQQVSAAAGLPGAARPSAGLPG